MSAGPREVCLAGAPAADQLHLLQGVSIQHTGPARVSAYFLPQPTGEQSDGLDVSQSSFRGRTLMGVQLPLPAGYSGAVLERRQTDSCDGVAPTSTWHARGTFDSFQYWNHDSTPLKSDGVRRCMQWAELATQLHAPISPQAVEQALAGAVPAAPPAP